MFNSIKRGFGFTFGRILFYIFIALIIALIGYLLGVKPADLLMSDVHAIEPDNSLIATTWNKYFKTSSSSNSTSTYFYSPKMYLWSEQYSKFNWYMWETTYNLTERMEMFKDWITSRSFTNINSNDLKFFIYCGASFNNNQIHNSSTLLSGVCSIVPFVDGGNQVTISERMFRINGTINNSVSNSTYVDVYYDYVFQRNGTSSQTYILQFKGANDGSWVNSFYLTNDFFTTPIEDFDTYLGNMTFREKNSTTGPVGTAVSQRIYYQSVPKYNGILNTYYPIDLFVYQSDQEIIFDTTTNTYYSFSDNTSFTEQTCHIINDMNSCSADFEFTDYFTFKENGGQISQNENGNVDETTTSQAEIDYTSNIDAINSNIIDPSIDTSDVDDLISNSNFNENETVQNIVRIPLNFISNLSTSCQPFNLTMPFINLDITIPCISTIFSSKLGTIFTIVQIIINGFVIYRILMGFVDLFNQLKDPTNDKLEVIQL